MRITSTYITVDGIKIYCETNGGPAEKGTIVCLGSAGRDTRQFHGLMEALREHFEVVAFDMPGHGKSWPLKGNKAIDEFHAYGDFILKTVDALPVKNPVYVGCALGGNMGFYLAQRQQTRAVVAMAGSDYSPNVNPAVAELLNHPYCSVQHSHLDFTDSLIGNAAPPENRDFILWGVCTEIGVAKAADYAGVYNGFDVRADMGRITCPVLMLRGAEDWTTHDESLHETMSRLTAAAKLDYKVLPGVGHYAVQEMPQLIAETIRDFLRNS